MNTMKLKLVVMGICGLVATPMFGHAASSAVQLSDTTALFTVEFAIEDDSFDVAIPVTTKPGATYADRIEEVGYTIQKRTRAEHNPVTTVTGVVLAPQVPIVDSRYQVPKGTRHVFTLLVVASFTDALSDDYQLKITKLPYWLDGRRTTIHQNQLDEIDPALLSIE